MDFRLKSKRKPLTNKQQQQKHLLMYVHELNSADSLCVNYSKGFVFTKAKKQQKKQQQQQHKHKQNTPQRTVKKGNHKMLKASRAMLKLE